MNWGQPVYEATIDRAKELGRPLLRLRRGLFWALLLLFIFSIVVFLFFTHYTPPVPLPECARNMHCD
jgi:hypothetical protein